MNQTVKILSAVAIPTALLNGIPAPYSLWLAGIIVLAVCMRASIQPPPAGSRWAVPYQILSILAGQIGWAVGRFSVGVTAIPVPRDHADAAKAALASADIPVIEKGKST